MLYTGLNRLNRCGIAQDCLQAVTGFLSECPADPEDGRRDLLPDGRLYVNIQHYRTRDFLPDKLEVHRKYADIQVLLAGREKIFTACPVEPADSPYDEQKDIAFYRTGITECTMFSLCPGLFIFLAPGDGHMPGVSFRELPGEVIKAVFKIRF